MGRGTVLGVWERSSRSRVATGSCRVVPGRAPSFLLVTA